VVESPARDEQDRQRDQGDGGEGRREDHECHDGEDDLQAAADDLDQRLPDELGQRLDVRSQARDEHAGTLALEEAERQGLELVEGCGPQRPEKAFAGRGREQGLRTDDERLRRGEAEEDHRGNVERVQVVLGDPGIDCVPDERRARECDQRRGDHRDGCAEVPALYRTDQLTGFLPDLTQRRALVHQAASVSRASRAR